MIERDVPSPGELVRHAYRRFEAERDHLLRIAAIPVFLQFLIFALLRPREQDLMTLLPALALALIPVTLFDVAWLRRQLGADSGDPPLPYRWTARHTGFIGRLVLLYVILMGAALPIVIAAALFPSGLGLVLQFICAPVFFYLSLRFSPFLVARALDEICDLRQSWETTREGVWRFFWGAAFVVLPLMILLVIIGELVFAVGFGQSLPLVMILVMTAAAYVIRSLLLIVIARIYELRMNRRASF